MNESFLSEFAKACLEGPRGLAIDVGANVGEWTVFLAEHFDRVVAIEPDTRAFAELQLNAPPNCSLHNAAAYHSVGELPFYRRPSALQSSLLELHPIGAGDQAAAPVVEVQQIPAVTVDSLRRRYGDPDFIKIDVEGAEAEVLQGITEIRPRLLIEVHDTAAAVGRQLERLGYKDIRIMRHPSPAAHPQHFWIYADGNYHRR